MLRSLLFFVAGLLSTTALAQSGEQPVSWSFSLGNSGEVYAVLAEAQVEDGWYIYSQFLDEGGPIPTSIDLSATEGIKLNGSPTEEGDAVDGYDELFEMQVKKFKHFASFTQAFTLPKEANTLTGTLQFMACTDKKCLPPQILDISLAVSPK